MSLLSRCNMILNFYIRKKLKLFKVKRSFSSTTYRTTVNSHLVINPSSCLHDEPVHIQIKNLSPGDEVTLTTTTVDRRGQNFFTYTYYRANDDGSVDLNKDGALGGTYEGVFPMGPIANLRPAPNEHKYLRFIKRDVSTPLAIDFKLLKGHLDGNDAHKADKNLIIDSLTHKRIYLAPNVQQIPVREGKIRGTLFLPEGDGPFPGVIDLFGTTGGLMEFRSAQLASRGVAALSVAYFDYEDLPKQLETIDLSYFEDAVHFLLSNKMVKQKGVGAIGVSKGADLACSMGTFIPEVKAVVSINGVPVNTWWPLKVRDRVIPGLPMDLDRIKFVTPQKVDTLEVLDSSELHPECHIPLHEADAQFLFIASLDDRNWRTEEECDRAATRMRERGKHNFQVLKYQGAGHLLEPPFSPFSSATYHKFVGLVMAWGGNPKEHTQAQCDSWIKILGFFKRNLN